MNLNYAKFIPVFIIIILLAGCMPIGYSELVSRHSDIYGDYSSGYMLVGVDQRYWKNKYEIDEDKSFIIAPGQVKNKVKIITHDFDIKQNSKYPRKRVYRLDSSGNEISYWMDGIYKLVLSLSNKKETISKELEIEVKTYIYIPLIHGAPN